MTDRDRPIVIEDDSYREEEAELLKDPIIVAMSLGVTREQIAAGSDGDFMMAALAEYRARGGNRHRTIGGPARAIRKLLDILGDDAIEPESAAAAVLAETAPEEPLAAPEPLPVFYADEYDPHDGRAYGEVLCPPCKKEHAEASEMTRVAGGRREHACDRCGRIVGGTR